MISHPDDGTFHGGTDVCKDNGRNVPVDPDGFCQMIVVHFAVGLAFYHDIVRVDTGYFQKRQQKGIIQLQREDVQGTAIRRPVADDDFFEGDSSRFDRAIDSESDPCVVAG
jgi:hypothetical protein